MKKSIITILLGAALSLSLAGRALAEDKTITGEGSCAKCVLNETKSCQNAIKVTEGGATVTYYLAQNDVSKEFHDNICKKSAQVTATGTVKEVAGKIEMTATKIELVK